MDSKGLFLRAKDSSKGLKVEVDRDYYFLCTFCLLSNNHERLITSVMVHTVYCTAHKQETN